MNSNRTPAYDPFSDPLDAILADIAINIQLPPSLHEKATGRYEAVRDYSERPASPLVGHIERFYPQGSMSIDATISHRGTDDEYDLDIIAELNIHHLTPPDDVLTQLYEALKDYPVRQVVRQTRCVTLRYADRMHLDVTPSVRLPASAERESHIFHAKENTAQHDHSHVPMNAWGFAEWYRARTPLEERFAIPFNRRFYEAYGYQTLAEAEHDDVPQQTPLQVKNTATVALQLLKRFRNVAYANAKGRIPPSIVMSYFAGRSAQENMTLSDMVIRQATMIITAIRQASARRQKIAVVNPAYPADCFTDRWPESITQQNEFANKLANLVSGMQRVRTANPSLEDLQSWLRDQFGERVVTKSLSQFNERTGQAVKAAKQAYSPSGRLYVPSAPSLITGSAAAVTPIPNSRPHTFMGGRRK